MAPAEQNICYSMVPVIYSIKVYPLLYCIVKYVRYSSIQICLRYQLARVNSMLNQTLDRQTLLLNYLQYVLSLLLHRYISNANNDNQYHHLISYYHLHYCGSVAMAARTRT